MTKFGTPYRPGTLAPRRTRYVVCYWDRVIFTINKATAEIAQGQLDYYRAEDSRIITAKEYRQS